MKNFLKRFLVILIALFVVFSFSACEKKASGNGKFEVSVVDQNAEQLYKTTIKFKSGDSAVDLLKNHEAIKLNGETSEYGFYVTGVYGIEAYSVGETYYWKLLVDGEASSVGISSIELVDGMKLEFVLIDWTTESWE